jgi:predicted transcriptional regulator
MQFDNVPAFMIDRAIGALERLKNQVDQEISFLRKEQIARSWQARRRDHMRKITHDLIKKNFTDENQARVWLTEQGHSWKYSGEILDALKDTIKRQKKAATEIEIFRRWNVGKEKKTALAREFGLSRATVERICKKLSENGDGLKIMFNITRGKKENGLMFGA